MNSFSFFISFRFSFLLYASRGKFFFPLKRFVVEGKRLGSFQIGGDYFCVKLYNTRSRAKGWGHIHQNFNGISSSSQVNYFLINYDRNVLPNPPLNSRIVSKGMSALHHKSLWEEKHFSHQASHECHVWCYNSNAKGKRRSEINPQKCVFSHSQKWNTTALCIRHKIYIS